MKKSLIFLLLTFGLTYSGAPLFAGCYLSKVLGISQDQDMEERHNSGTLSIFPRELLYHIIEQGLPKKIESIQAFDQALKLIVPFAAANRYCRRIAHTLCTNKLAMSKQKAEQFWDDVQLIMGSNHSPSLPFLVELGVDVNRKIKGGRTALIAATEYGNRKAVAFLLAHRVEVDAQDREGWTSLMKASFNGYKDLVELFLQHGATISLRNDEGKTAFDLANEDIQGVLY